MNTEALDSVQVEVLYAAQRTNQILRMPADAFDQRGMRRTVAIGAYPAASRS